jgi:hypothetical protein
MREKQWQFEILFIIFIQKLSCGCFFSKKKKKNGGQDPPTFFKSKKREICRTFSFSQKRF